MNNRPPSGWRMWLAGARPRTLTIAVVPVLLATALAVQQGAPIAPLVVVLALVASVLIQAGTNLWNDVADGAADGAGRQGPPRLTAMGWASPQAVRRAALICFAMASACGLYLGWVGGWPIIALGLAALLAGWAYSCGAWPISHTPLGELFVVAFFGIGAVGGMVWLLVGQIGLRALVLGLAIGLAAAAVLHVNNTRDIVSDGLAGRRTLAIALGRHRAGFAYAAMVGAPLLLLPLVPGGWLALLAAPEAIRLIHRFATGRRFNPLLGETARYQVLLALLAALGMVL